MTGPLNAARLPRSRAGASLAARAALAFQEGVEDSVRQPLLPEAEGETRQPEEARACDRRLRQFAAQINSATAVDRQDRLRPWPILAARSSRVEAATGMELAYDTIRSAGRIRAVAAVRRGG